MLYEYEKPILEKEEEMIFTKEVWEEFNDGQWCFGCTNCNCKREHPDSLDSDALLYFWRDLFGGY